MIYLVGIVMDVKESGITVNAGEERRCNIYVFSDSKTEWPSRIAIGDRVRVAADALWEKSRDETFKLRFLAKRIEVR